MRTKLLKKIRKRYRITYYPKEIYLFNEKWKGPIWLLEDAHNSWRSHLIGNENQDPENALLDKLQDWIKKDYFYARKRKTQQKVEIIWPRSQNKNK